MSDDARWAARYQFLEELWRGRERVLVDCELEAVLRDGGPGVAHGSHPSLRELLDEIVPRDTVAVRVWMGVANADTAHDLGRSRDGTRFVTRSQLSGVLRTEGWQVALVDLSPFVAAREASAHPQEEERSRDTRGRFLPKERGPVDQEGETLLRLLGAGVRHRGRAVALVVPAREFPATADGLTYEEVASILEEHLGGGRVFGVFSPAMAAVVQFGYEIEAEDGETGEDSDEGERRSPGEGSEESEEDEPYEASDHASRDDDESDAEEDADDEDVPLSYDNSLGMESPRILQFVAVAGTDLEFGDGLTLIELPSNGEPTEARETGAAAPADASGMRAQLAEALRQADLAAIERQDSVEQADRILSQKEALEEEVAALRDALARLATDSSDTQVPATGTRDRAEASFDLGDGVTAEGGDVAAEDSAPDERLDAVLAREQGIRWQLGKAQAELVAARKRPVDELEAEVASLRAQLEAVLEEPAAAALETASADDPRPAGQRQESPGPADARRRARRAATRALDRLVRKVEREGIGALELRRELMTLGRLLRS